MFAIFRLLNFIISTLFYGSSGSVHPTAPMLGIFLVIHRSWSLINSRSKGNCNFCRKVLFFVIVGCALNLWMTWFVWCDFLFAQLRLKTERVRRKMLRSLQSTKMICYAWKILLFLFFVPRASIVKNIWSAYSCFWNGFRKWLFRTFFLDSRLQSVAFKPVL